MSWRGSVRRIAGEAAADPRADVGCAEDGREATSDLVTRVTGLDLTADG